MKLTESLRQLIIEGASHQEIYDAIRDKQVLVLYYDGDEPGGKGERVVEPVALGESLAGNKVLRAWDYEGASHTAFINKKPLPGWRLFRLDKILFLQKAGYTFGEERPNYNRNGDKKMNKVYIKADFTTPPKDVEAQPYTKEKEVPKEPTTGWLQSVKNKFKSFVSRFKK